MLILLNSRAIAGVRGTVGRAGGCDSLLDNGTNAFRTSLPLQKKDPLELTRGGVMGRSLNLGFSGVLSSYTFIDRMGSETAGYVFVFLGRAGSNAFMFVFVFALVVVSKGVASSFLDRTVAALLDLPTLGSLFSMFL